MNNAGGLYPTTPITASSLRCPVCFTDVSAETETAPFCTTRHQQTYERRYQDLDTMHDVAEDLDRQRAERR